jgi:hypothetical protein
MRRSIKLVFLIIPSIVIGYLLGSNFQPIETDIVVHQAMVTRYTKQSDGPHEMLYLTTGPIISSFNKNCDAGIGSFLYYCGIDLHYDGKAGIIELKIPTGMTNEIDPVREALVSYFYPIQIPFQRIGTDSYHSMFRIEVPDNYDKIVLREGSELPQSISLLVNSFFAGICIFFASILIFVLFDEVIGRFKRSRVKLGRPIG